MTRIVIACILLFTGGHIVAQSIAHDLSRSIIIDPVYSAKEVIPVLKSRLVLHGYTVILN